MGVQGQMVKLAGENWTEKSGVRFLPLREYNSALLLLSIQSQIFLLFFFSVYTCLLSDIIASHWIWYWFSIFFKDAFGYNKQIYSLSLILYGKFCYFMLKKKQDNVDYFSISMTSLKSKLCVFLLCYRVKAFILRLASVFLQGGCHNSSIQWMKMNLCSSFQKLPQKLPVRLYHGFSQIWFYAHP